METFNPFIMKVYLGEDYFCNRNKEREEIIQNAINFRSTTLFSPRRMGKTGLIFHIFEKYSKENEAICLYTDILSAQNLRDLTEILANKIFNKLDIKKGLVTKLREAIKSLRPVLRYNSITGEPEVSFDFNTTQQYEHTLQELLFLLDKQGVPVIVTIDEFQQVSQFPEKNTEALLRSIMQQLKNTQFIFSGSNQKMMHQIFNHAKRPFFASCANLHLKEIDRSEYAQFVSKHFENRKRNISHEAIAYIMDFSFMHTYYAQYFCHYVFAKGIKKIDEQAVRLCAYEILKQNESIYYQYRNLLTHTQWEVLRAIGKEEKVYQIQSTHFINKHKLGTPSSVKRSVDALMEKEMIYRTNYEEKPYYIVYDKFLLRWMQYI